MQAVAEAAVTPCPAWLSPVMAGAMGRIKTRLVLFPIRAEAVVAVGTAAVRVSRVMAVRALSSSDTRWPHNG